MTHRPTGNTWRRIRGRGAARLALLALVIVFVGWQSRNLGAFAPDYDEGVYLSEARLVYQGYSLYTEVETALPPGLPWALAGAFAVAGGPSVHAARLTIVLTGALSLVAVAAIGAQVVPGDDLWTGVAAALLLAAVPLWYLYGRLAMADVPSLAFTLVGVAFALRSWSDQHRIWLVAAGIAAALSLAIKLSAAYVAPLIALIVLLRPRDAADRKVWLRSFVADGSTAVAGFLAPLLLILLMLDLPAAFEMAIRYHWVASREWIGPPYSLNTLKTFVLTHAGWALLALLGVFWYGCIRRWRELLFIIGWGVLVGLLLTEHNPLWQHLLLILVPPMAVAGGVALAGVMRAASTRSMLHDLPAWATLIALGIAIVTWPVARNHDGAALGPPSHVLHLETIIVPWLDAIVPPDQMIITDAPMIAFRAERNVPPNLTDTSYTRIVSGFLTAEELIATTVRERPAAIIFWRDRFTLLPAWLDWVRTNYELRCELGPERLIFLRPDVAAATDGC